ncbi:MAG: hypothetical protein L6Q71_04735 [Planctomycetes bacterium]|nr:hypothetical protein [Planctomycetota bacterium]NUQ35216.1 hypothetical protein [Planctomycetaceae bacterium]
MNLLGKLCDDRNRLWSFPLVAALVALAATVVRTGHDPALRVFVEMAVSAGAAFVLTAGWMLVQDLRTGWKKLPSRAEQYAELKVQGGMIAIVHEELRSLEAGLQEYLVAKKTEGLKFRDQIMDLENDVARIKASDPTMALKGQLSLIADKFGELAGVRAMVNKIAGKLDTVEKLARQAEDAHVRLAQRGWSAAADDGSKPQDWFASIEARIEAVRAEVSAAQKVDVMAEVRAMLDEKVSAGVKELLAGMDEAKLAELMVSGQDEKFKGIDKRMTKMSKTIDGLQKALENLRWAGGEDNGIPSIYRTVQGLAMNDPNNKMKAGCLTKLFEANVALRKAA